MKKVRIDERLENVFDTFFDAGDDKNLKALVLADGAGVLQNEEQTAFIEKGEFWINIARQAFLFLPGAFLLFFATLSSIFFFPNFGFNWQMLFWLFTGGFLCFVGLGSMKDIKNLLIPLSIILFSTVIAISFALFPSSAQPTLYFEYSIYLFPLVLIVSRLLKSWIDDK